MVIAFEERAPILEGQHVSLICESSQDSSELWEMTELAGDLLHSPCQVGCETIGCIYDLWAPSPELRRAASRGSWEWEVDQLAPVVLLQHPSLLIAWKEGCWQSLWPRLNWALKQDKTSSVHPFEMGPNYVLLINETLWPNRENTVEKILCVEKGSWGFQKKIWKLS